jgi:pantoate--beta-alanine ligase
MDVAKTIIEVRKLVRQARHQGRTIGFVPTMGALHQGHVSLIEAAAGQGDFIVVSIFVNPTQFGPSEDFSKYPRPIEQDLEICKEHGVELVFAPSPREMYGQEGLTWVDVERLTEPLCGRFRPGHFRGVSTVCAKLFNIVLPDRAFLGQKDAQQAVVIRRMVKDLNMPLEVVVCPTVREPDGLAKSSRNQYLSPVHRSQAATIYKALRHGEDEIRRGIKDGGKLVEAITAILRQVPGIEIQYVSIVDAESLQPKDPVAGRVLVAVAVRIGSTRLIDNIVVDAG